MVNPGWGILPSFVESHTSFDWLVLKRSTALAKMTLQINSETLLKSDYFLF